MIICMYIIYMIIIYATNNIYIYIFICYDINDYIRYYINDYSILNEYKQYFI